ncbi:MAG: HAD family phosphatase [Candidatus Aminicenantes bacterium]|nr:HAD family phosphatase [Candidatus Aminicenantes bacterium]NLH76002.1 HAD family phosphatase [Acidobacteriota bacterium]
MIDTVISDLGRVVLWFDNNVFLRKLAARAGRPFEEVKAAVHGDLGLIRAFDGGAVTPAGFLQRVTAAAGASLPYEDFYAIYNDIFTPNGPAIDVLGRVKRAGYRTLLLSNTDPERFAFVRRRFPEVLFFDGYVLSYELKLLKPDPAIYRAAVRQAGSEPGRCVFIDDMEENVAGAKAAGLSGILYRPETDLAGELKKLGLKF